jgi:hypothetical protein
MKMRNAVEHMKRIGEPNKMTDDRLYSESRVGAGEERCMF